MNITIDNLKQLKPDQVYSALLPLFNDVLKKYNFIIQFISENDLISIFKTEILLSYKNYDGNIPYPQYIRKAIEENIKLKIKNLLDDPHFTFDIINSYINDHIISSSNINDIFNFFMKLETFFDNFKININLELLIKIINENQKLNEILNTLYLKYKDEIMKGNPEVVFDNELLSSFFDAYFIINNIDIYTDSFFVKINQDNIKYDDNLSIYMHEIKAIKLLTAEDEKILFNRKNNGDEKAKRILIEANLRLVVYFAYRYVHKGINLLDLIEDGNIGLMKAVDRFDTSLGYRFSSYASWWIKQAIVRGLANTSRNIRLSVHSYNKLPAFKNAIDSLRDELNREPTVEEVAKKINYSVAQTARLFKFANDAVSINALVGDDNDTELQQLISSNMVDNVDEYEYTCMKSDVGKILQSKRLSEKEKNILKLRYGFINNRCYTLNEVGNIYGVTRERIRQIESGALKKVRSLKLVKGLGEYVDYAEINTTFEIPKTEIKIEKLSKEKEKKTMRKIKLIYEYLDMYTKEEVDCAISQLDDESLLLLKKRYGEDLEHPISTKLSKEDSYTFYGIVIPKIRRILSGSRTDSARHIYKYFQQYSLDELNAMLSELSSEDKRLLILKYGPNLNYPTNAVLTNNELNHIYKVTIPKAKKILERNRTNESVVNVNTSNFSFDATRDNLDNEVLNIDKDTCNKLLDLLRTPSFFQMLDSLTVKESIIVALKLGYVDGKCFSSEKIASFLEISIAEVIEVTKKTLLLYKDNINNFIDYLIVNSMDNDQRGNK